LPEHEHERIAVAKHAEGRSGGSLRADLRLDQRLVPEAGRRADVPRGPESTEIFFDVYDALDPGCGVVAENPRNGR